MARRKVSSATLQESAEEKDAFDLTVEVTPRKMETGQQTRVSVRGDDFIDYY